MFGLLVHVEGLWILSSWLRPCSAISFSSAAPSSTRCRGCYGVLGFYGVLYKESHSKCLGSGEDFPHLRRLDNSTRALTSLSKFCEGSLVNIWLNILMWVIACFVSFIRKLNNCRIRVSFEELDVFLYNFFRFSQSMCAVCYLAILKYTFSARCIHIISRASSSTHCHSSKVFMASALASWMASIWCLWTSTSYIISFHNMKFLSLNIQRL